MNFQFPWQNNSAPDTSSPNPSLIPLLEAIREGVIIIGEDTRTIVSNQAARNSFTRYEENLEGRRLSEIIRDFDLHEAFRKTLEEGKSVDVKIEVLSFDRRKYRVHTAPFEFEGKKCAIGFFYDITKVEHLENVRQEFLSNISHELRTPLTSIMAFVETLEDGAINDKNNNRRFLGVIRKNAERMHRLIDDISELSMIESGRVRVDIKPRNLPSVIEEIYTNFSSKAETRNIELISKVDNSTVVYADAVRLEQMLTNLVDNAIKFNREAGKVVISHRQTEDRDIVSVTDTGEGISQEHLKRIFERFYRSDRARSREIGGTGLGLAIVKHLARLHGGEVSVNSTLGQSTTFCFELPRPKQ